MIDGVEAVVKVMETFPKCQALQEQACCVLAKCIAFDMEIGINSAQIEVVLAALNNHAGKQNA